MFAFYAKSLPFAIACQFLAIKKKKEINLYLKFNSRHNDIYMVLCVLRYTSFQFEACTLYTFTCIDFMYCSSFFLFLHRVFLPSASFCFSFSVVIFISRFYDKISAIGMLCIRQLAYRNFRSFKILSMKW